MGKIVSPAGDMDIKVSGVSTSKDQLVVTGRFGAWDAKIYFTVDEVFQLIRMAFKGSVILYILRLPFVYAGRHLFSRKAE